MYAMTVWYFLKLLFQFQMVKLNFCVVIWLDTVLETWWYWPNIKEGWLKVARDWSLIEDVFFCAWHSWLDWMVQQPFLHAWIQVSSCIRAGGFNGFLIFTPDKYSSIYIYIYIKECIYIYKYKYICICIYIFQMCSYSPWLMEAIFRFVSEFSHVDKKVTGFWPRRRALVWWSSWNENPGSFHWSNEMGMLPIQWGCFPSFKEKQGTHYLEKHQMMFFKSKMKQLNNNDHQRFPGKN